jgi:L-ascorbate metabolism protein UlaG (beta-lactamase superfamily)
MSRAKESIEITQEFFDYIDYTRITWLGGAGFLINTRGTIILIDPVLMVQPEHDLISETGLKLYSKYPVMAFDIPRVDYVFYTHPDNDHLGNQTALILAKKHPNFIGPLSVYKQLTILGIEPNNIETCRSGDKIRIKDFLLEITPADHPWQLLNPKVYGKPFRKDDCCGFIITMKDARCYFPGDTRLMEEHLAIHDIDLLALDVSNDLYHLGKDGAVVLANSLPDAFLIPIHYGTYDAPDITAHIGNPNDIFIHVENRENRAKIVAPGEVLSFKNRVLF